MFLPDAEKSRNITASLVDALIVNEEAISALVPDSAIARRLVARNTDKPNLRHPTLDSIVYAHHYRAMSAAREQRWDECQAALEAMRIDIAPAQPFHCVRWGDERLIQRKTDALLRCVNNDLQSRIVFRPVEAVDFAHLERLTAEALDLLRQAAPDLAGELTELVRELVFANCDPDGFAFDGITSFYCWGALFLNAAEHRDLIALVDGLSHEGAHSYLFGLAAGKPYLVNGLGARFSSPLRADPRPLEGIYHATFVSARMHYAQSRLLASGLLSPEHADAADDARDAARQAFYAGLQTLQAHAEFTPLGRALMDDTLAYMRSEDA